jgi:hypothetical protein
MLNMFTYSGYYTVLSVHLVCRMKKEDEGRQAEKASKATPESKGGFGSGKCS